MPNPSSDDLIILGLTEWILEKDFKVRPYTSDITEKINSILKYEGGFPGDRITDIV